MQIIPTIIEKDFIKAEEKIRMVSISSKWVQIDVTDNVMVKGMSFQLELLNKLDINSENMLWDIHLMVKEPIDWVEKCIFVGASRITGQVEMMSDRENFVKKVKDEGVEAGLAFDIDSKIGDIPEETDLVVLMGRKAGFGVFDLDERVYKKIEFVKERKFALAVDGGVDEKNINKLLSLGVDVVYSGSNYFKIKNVG